MMFQLGDDGVVSSVNEDDLIYVDKNELEQFIESYQELEKENEQLKKQVEIYKGDGLETLGDLQRAEENNRKVLNNIEQLEKENEQLKQQLAHHTRMHEWFRNEAYLLQNKLDNREDEIRRLKGDVE